MTAEAAIAQVAWDRLFRAATKAIADCFARRETRATAEEMASGLLAEVDTRYCWTLSLFHNRSELVGCRVRTAWTLRVAMACSTSARIFAWDRLTAF